MVDIEGPMNYPFNKNIKINKELTFKALWLTHKINKELKFKALTDARD